MITSLDPKHSRVQYEHLASYTLTIIVLYGQRRSKVWSVLGINPGVIGYWSISRFRLGLNSALSNVWLILIEIVAYVWWVLLMGVNLGWVWKGGWIFGSVDGDDCCWNGLCDGVCYRWEIVKGNGLAVGNNRAGWGQGFDICGAWWLMQVDWILHH